MLNSVTGNKGELAAKLRVSLPTLSSWMLRYSEFPILSKGSNGRSYEFDFIAVFDFLRARQDEQALAQAEKDEALAQLKLPFNLPGVEPPPTGKTLSVKDELDAWRLRKAMREEMEEAGKLVPAAEMLAAVSAVLARINRDAHAFLRQVAREQSWPDAYTRTVEARFGDLQRAAVKDLTTDFAPPTEEPAQAHAYA